MAKKASDKHGEGGIHIDLGGALRGLFGGLGDLVTKLGEIAEKGEELKKSGEFDFANLSSGSTKGLKGVYGFSVKVGGAGSGETISIEPFGNIKQDAGGQTVVEDAYEPIVDIFEESDHVLVIAELPGVEEKDVSVELRGDILTIHGDRGDKKYHKEVLLPLQASEDRMHRVCRNGILEVKITR